LERTSERHGTAPPLDDDRTLHERLLARDPNAPSELAEAHLPPLVRRLRQRFPTLDEHLLEEVAIDLILSVAEHPRQYDPSRASLTAYLHMAARRDVQNALRSRGRQTRALRPLEDVELAQSAGNLLAETPSDPAEITAMHKPLDPETAALLRQSFSPLEWEAVQLVLEGERRTSIYADLLEIRHLAEADQAREVKRVKDRLLKRLQRLAPKVPRDR
jgi:RNA polymerase sigma-70 factor (ECF subfamily)